MECKFIISFLSPTVPLGWVAILKPSLSGMYSTKQSTCFILFLQVSLVATGHPRPLTYHPRPLAGWAPSLARIEKKLALFSYILCKRIQLLIKTNNFLFLFVKKKIHRTPGLFLKQRNLCYEPKSRFIMECFVIIMPSGRIWTQV